MRIRSAGAAVAAKGMVSLFALAMIVAGCRSEKPVEAEARYAVVAGRNEIALYTDPLSIEVRRDGVTVVARTEIGMTVDGHLLGGPVQLVADELELQNLSDCKEASPVYKKGSIDLNANSRYLGFGAWGVRLTARPDGVAYRFETSFPGEITVNGECAGVTVPDASAKCWAWRTGAFGQEETVCLASAAGELKVDPASESWRGKRMIYLPFVYSAGGKTVAFTESDVFDYPVLNLLSTDDRAGGVRFGSLFAGWPTNTFRAVDGPGYQPVKTDAGGRWVTVAGHADDLVKTAGARTFPWRVFVVADEPSGLCESDAVYALARPAAKGSDFSWVKPGKVAWDWWNCFDNQGDTGCNTKTYRRFVDFAAAHGIEYVILDEGWSERLNIWKFHPDVDVPGIVEYAKGKGVGIILWMAWAQIVGDEENVAKYFAKLGAKGFKVDFMDRGDAEVERFLWTFADACARHKMLIDYHGSHRPTGMTRAYPNIVNYEGIHGLEQMKWFGKEDILANDVRAFYGRLTAGPMDYTPGAMLNFRADGSDYTVKRSVVVSNGAATVEQPYFPGSLGTRSRQMAMMALYEAPLQMLCDSPSNYERNAECFAFMAATPVVWDDTVGLGGDPDSFAAAARQARDGSWYAAAIGDRAAHEVTVDTARFLKAGDWSAEIFRDAPESDREPMKYVREKKSVKAGEKLVFRLAPGGGFVVKFTR